MNGVNTKVVMASYVEDNTSQGEGWIFDSSSKVHVCSHKEMFNSLVVKEEGTIKTVNGSACEVDTEAVMLHTKKGQCML